MGDSPRTPPRASLKRSRNSESPITPHSIRQGGTPPLAPRASARHIRRRLNPTTSDAARNLSLAFEEVARLQEEADEFYAEQDGMEQEVPENVFAEPSPEITYSGFYGDVEDEVDEDD